MDWFRFTLLFVAILAALSMAAVVIGDYYFGAEWPRRREDVDDGP